MKPIIKINQSYLIFLFLLSSSCSQSREYYQFEDYDNVKKIDTHVHIMTESDHFVKSAQANNFQLLTIVVDSKNSWEWVEERYRYSEYQMRNHPETVQFATSFSMEGWDEEGWLEKSMNWLDSGFQQGAIGIKVWKNIGMVYRDQDSVLVRIDDPRFDPIFNDLSERNIPVVGHLGEPLNCWLPLEEMTTKNDSGYFSRHPEYHMYKHPDMPSHEEQMEARDNMLAKNPDLRFVGAHMASLEYDVDQLSKRLERFPNMAVDMAARMGQIFYQTANNYEKVRSFFIKYQDRLLYATDLADGGSQSAQKVNEENTTAWKRDWRFLVTDEVMTSDLVDQEFKGLKLPREVIDKIYHDNAVKWLNIFSQAD